MIAAKGTLAPTLHTGGLVALARTLSCEDFSRRFAHPFLLRPRKLDTGQFPQGGNAWDAEIRTIDAPVELAGGLVERLRFAPLVRSGISPYTGFISIGCAENCDLVVKHRSIAKLHALFWIPAVGEAWRIADARSAEGTFVNGQRLLENEKRALQPGDAIRFGNVITRLVDAAQVFEFLNPSQEKRTWQSGESRRTSSAR